MAEVTDVDLDARTVALAPVANTRAPESLPYDTLVVAAGSQYSYFGHDEFGAIAHEVKSLESALTVRAQILGAFENAELELDDEARRADLTFVVVGGGPTGVEMAGQIAEMARSTLPRDFRSIEPQGARILLVEAADRVLTAFSPSLSEKARRSLVRLGVEPMLNRMVVDLDDESVTVQDGDGERETIPTRTVIWAAGVHASALAQRLGGADRRRRRPRGAPGRRGRPVAARPPRGARARRHGSRAPARRQHPHAARRGAGGDPAGPPRRARDPRPPGRPAAPSRSPTPTRATWRRSAAAARSRSFPACGSAGCRRGWCGCSSTSGT